MNLQDFFADVKRVLAQAMANLALNALQAGHISKAQLLDEAHADAKQIVADTLQASGVLHEKLGLPLASAVPAVAPVEQSN